MPSDHQQVLSALLVPRRQQEASDLAQQLQHNLRAALHQHQHLPLHFLHLAPQLLQGGFQRLVRLRHLRLVSRHLARASIPQQLHRLRLFLFLEAMHLLLDLVDSVLSERPLLEALDLEVKGASLHCRSHSAQLPHQCSHSHSHRLSFGWPNRPREILPIEHRSRPGLLHSTLAFVLTARPNPAVPALADSSAGDYPSPPNRRPRC